MHEAPSDRRLFLAVLLVAVLLAVPMRGANFNRTLDLVHSLARGRLTIDDEAWNTTDRACVHEAPRSADVSTGETAPSAALLRRHYYSGGAPALSFLLAPFYRVARGLPELPLALLLVVLGAGVPLAAGTLGVRRAVSHATGCTSEVATTSALLHAFGTLALPYGTRLFAHSLTVACLSWALALVLDPRPGGRRAALAGLLAATAVASDYLAGVPALGLLVLAAIRGRAQGAGAFLAGGAFPAFLLGAYHEACFGSPWSTAYQHHDDPFVVAICSTRMGFALPDPWILFQLVLGTRRGMLETEPGALLGAVGLVLLARKKSRPHQVALAVALVVLLLNAGRTADWHSGYAWGSRYAVNALPFLALGYPRGFELLGRARNVVLGASILVALAGTVGPWGFDVWQTLEGIAISGPRADGAKVLAHALLPGAGPGTLTLLVVHELAGAMALLPVLLAWRVSPSTRAVLVVAPFLAFMPAELRAFVSGPAGVEAAQRESSRRAVLRQLDAATDGFSAHDAERAALEGGFTDLSREARARREALSVAPIESR